MVVRGGSGMGGVLAGRGGAGGGGCGGGAGAGVGVGLGWPGRVG